MGIFSLQGCVHGVLTVSTTSLMFKPNRSDSLVQEHGLEQYELLVPLNDITHASITRDVAPPRRREGERERGERERERERGERERGERVIVLSS